MFFEKKKLKISIDFIELKFAFETNLPLEYNKSNKRKMFRELYPIV